MGSPPGSDDDRREREKNMKLNYSVGFRVNEDKAHGIDKHYRIIAAFENPTNAEDFIRNCMPEENQDRFFIIANDKRFYPITKEVENI